MGWLKKVFFPEKFAKWQPAHQEKKAKPVERRGPDLTNKVLAKLFLSLSLSDLANEALVKLCAVERTVEEDDRPDHLGERDHRIDPLQWCFRILDLSIERV